MEEENGSVSLHTEPFNSTEARVTGSDALGVSTVGSSEAIILAVLAAKKRWQASRRAAGKSTENPNIVMSSAVHVCWEKAARYLDVEEKFVYCTEDNFVMDPKEAVALVDENTILVCALLGMFLTLRMSCEANFAEGTTYTGQYEDVKGMSDLLETKNKELGTDVWIHV